MTIEASLVYSGATHAAHSYWDVEDLGVFDDCSRFLARCLRRGPIETLVPQVGVGVWTFELWGTELRVWDGDTDAPDFSAHPRRTLHKRWERIRFVFVRHTSEGRIRFRTELVGPVHDLPWEE